MKKFCITIVLVLSNIIFIQAQWKECNNNLFGAIIRCIAVNDEFILLGTFTNGIYKSTDNGINWLQNNTGLTSLNISAIEISGENIFIGTDKGVFISDDKGNTWNPIGLNNRVISKLIVNGANLYVCTSYNGIYFSSDNGNNWKNIGFATKFIDAIYIEDDKIYVGTNNSIHISSDNGISWKDLTENLMISARAIQIINNIIYVGTYSQGIFISTDNGNTWEQLENEFSDFTVNSIIYNNDEIYVCTENSVYRSIDKGENWIDISPAINQQFILTMSVFEQDIYLSIQGLGIFYSNDKGENWIDIGNGITNTYIISMYKNNQNLYAGTFLNGLFHSTDDGNYWQQIFLNQDYYRIYSIIEFNDNIFIGSEKGTIFNSSDMGKNWNKIELNPIHPDSEPETINSFLIFQNNLYVGANRLYIAEDDENNWRKLSLDKIVYSIVNKDNSIFVGTNQFVYLSTDNGETWEQKKEGLLNNTRIPNILVSNENIYAVTLYSGIFMSSDNGETWSEKNSGLTNMNINTLVEYYGNLFVGTEGGVFLSTDYGDNWVEINSGLKNINVQTLTIKNDIIFAGTFGDGVYCTNLSALGIVSVNQDLINNNKLKIYPNPTAELINIESELMLSKITLSDNLGRIILDQTENVRQIYTKGISSGSYILNLYFTNGEVLTKKVIITNE